MEKESHPWPRLPREREKRFAELYRDLFPAVAAYVAKRGGTWEEAKDIFQDALIAYYEKSTQGLQLRQGADAYIVGCAKFLWLKKYRENSRRAETGTGFAEEPAAETVSERRLLGFLETAGQKCMELLRAVYYDKLRMDEVATRFGFSGERSATVQKYKCLQKVRETVKEKSLAYEDFLV